MCHMHGPEPKAAFIPTKEDQDKATESMRKFYAPQGEDARRLARYDEAVSIVQRYYTECMRQGILFGPINGDAADFLAAEGRK